MATTSLSLSLSSPSIFKPKPSHFHNTHNSFLPTTTLPSTNSKFIHFYTPTHKIPQKNINFWRNNATSSEILPSESIPVDSSEQIVVSTGDEGVATIIQALLFIAFVALSVLTIGVIYIAVTDFLQKREKEKFEKEEAAAAKKRKGGKKLKVRSRAGPRGFGQKIDEFDD